MRETPRSLRGYFILVGLYSTAASAFTIFYMVSEQVISILSGLVLLSLLMGLAYLYVGAKLPTLLRDNPQLPLRLTTVAIVLALLSKSVLGILLNVYIFYQLKRMAREASPEMESQVLE